jgi:2-amino-4-hydroxy-6-hydroxymethyldihydropteridine diphosphokinase
LEIASLETVDVFVGLGSNLGDSARTLLKAWKILGEQEGIELKNISSPYISSPVDMTSANWFTNAVGHLTTTLSAYQLLDILLETEQSLGRVRKENHRGYQDRVVDLDLLYYGVLIQGDPRLTVPHPHLYERLFVLAPLDAIAPEFIDPDKKVSISALYHGLLGRIDHKIIENQEIKKSDWDDT